jgi:Na+-transporting methylmalonyl-CoA/oxaloacetate decarboxylase gamma subunit
MGPETVDWGYAISTLIIRFVGIFVVLGILQVIMQLTGRVFARLDAKHKDTLSTPSTPRPEALSQEQAAAVAMALYLCSKDS